jgi:hypothetical protein
MSIRRTTRARARIALSLAGLVVGCVNSVPSLTGAGNGHNGAPGSNGGGDGMDGDAGTPSADEGLNASVDAAVLDTGSDAGPSVAPLVLVPSPLVNSPQELAIDDTNVYWIDTILIDDGWEGIDRLMRVPKEGGTEVMLLGRYHAWPGPNSMGIALSATNVYWITTEGYDRIGASPVVWTVPKTGGPAVAVPGTDGAFSGAGTTNLAIDGTNIYFPTGHWIAGSADKVQGISSVPLTGGYGTVIVPADGASPVGPASIQRILSDGSNVYYDAHITSDEAWLIKVPVGGGARETLVFSNNPSEAITHEAWNFPSLQGGFVYWLSSAGSLFQESVGGGPPIRLAERAIASSQVPVSDGTNVYYMAQPEDRPRPGLYRVPVAGGKPVLVLEEDGHSVDNFAGVWSGAARTGPSVAIDDRSVYAFYCSDRSNTPSCGIFKIAK